MTPISYEQPTQNSKLKTVLPPTVIPNAAEGPAKHTGRRPDSQLPTKTPHSKLFWIDGVADLVVMYLERIVMGKGEILKIMKIEFDFDVKDWMEFQKSYIQKSK